MSKKDSGNSTSDRKWQLSIGSAPGQLFVGTNLVYGNKSDFGDETVYVMVKDNVYKVGVHDSIPVGILGLNGIQRRSAKVSMNEKLEIPEFSQAVGKLSLDSVGFEVDTVVRNRNPPDGVDGQELISLVLNLFENHFLKDRQEIVCDYHGTNLILRVVAMITGKVQQDDAQEEGSRHGRLVPETVVTLEKPHGSALSLINLPTASTTNVLFRHDFDFESLGIGGLDNEFSEIFRRAFASRVFPPEVIVKLQVNHVKGILLHGPPGTGKTLIARQIGKLLNCREPKVVNGPEILSKYVGESEERVRQLFAEAEEEQAQAGESSGLHLIIFDEIDAICKTRGSVRDGTGVHDSIVNQLLSKIDGVGALNNVLIIGMTNRKDMLDEALLRPGRFEVLVEIGLANEDGRYQIFRIHTKNIRKEKYMGEDVDLRDLAQRTNNYSGAEIEGVVKSALSFAFDRQVDVSDPSKKIDASTLSVNKEDFDTAIEEVKPAFGVDQEDFDSYIREPLISYGARFEEVVDACASFSRQVQTSDRTNLLSVLLEGPRGSGKTAIAAHQAVSNGFPFVKILAPETMMGYPEWRKMSKLSKVFDDAYKSPMSVVVLDDIERLMEYVHIGRRFSNAILQLIFVCLRKTPRPGRRLLIIGTTSHIDILREMELIDAFNVVVHVPSLNGEEVKSTCEQMNVFSEAEEGTALNMVPPEIGIKQLLLVLDMAKTKNGGFPIESELFERCLRECGIVNLLD